MKYSFWSFLFCFFIFLIISNTACKKEIGNNSGQDNSIELSVTIEGRSIILGWTKVDNADFEKYIIVRSNQPINNEVEPVEGLLAINDFKVNHFEDVAYPAFKKLYYKIYVDLGGRYVYSPTVSVDLDVILLGNLNPVNVAYDEENNFLFLYDFLSFKLYRLDLYRF